MASQNSKIIDSPIQFLKGVGPKLAVLLEQKDIRTVRDALFFLPRDYQDRSKLTNIAEIKPEENALLHLRIASYNLIPMRGKKRFILEARAFDAVGNAVSLKWFQYNRTYLIDKLKAARISEKPSVLAYGKATHYQGKTEMIHPDVDWSMDEADLHSAKGIVPIYSETAGLTQKMIRKIVHLAVDTALKDLEEDLPLSIIEEHELIGIREALYSLHHPYTEESLEKLKNFQTRAHQRLIFEEFFKFEWSIGQKRLSMRTEKTKSLQNDLKLSEQLKSNLAFTLTNDQLKAIEKIQEDLGKDVPMNRLLLGDVGCGKTLVAFFSLVPVLKEKGQAALLVPTEILAEQHFKNALNLFKDVCVVETLTGSTPKQKREEILSGLQSGEISFLIGTHALIEEVVKFKSLNLIIIDEQHRFGVDQRMRLRVKGKSPHLLSMTATPIPRTLALTAYGDLDVSAIRELPKGRPEIHTKIFREKERAELYELIIQELKSGRQAYVIFPLVEESEKVDLADAMKGAEELANGALKGYRIGLLHGRMKSKEKSEVMNKFKAGDIQVLVSTTVVEVGVDVPNATVLVIENAERFGLSQLHQLRGRIGRGVHKSYCALVTAGSSDVAFARLRAMENTRDGFKLAEMDLELRGPGEFLGTRQSGELQFKFANLMRDQFALNEARQSAFALIKEDPNLTAPKNSNFKRYIQTHGKVAQTRFQTSG